MKKQTKTGLLFLTALAFLASCSGINTNTILYAPGDEESSETSDSSESSSSEESSEELSSEDSSETSSDSSETSSSEISSEDSSETSSDSSETSSSEISSSEESSETSSESSESSSSEESSSSSSGESSSSSSESSETSSSDSSSSSGDSSSSSDGESILIGSVQEWNDFATYCNVNAGYSEDKFVYLRSDLDFSGEDFVPISVFEGEFDGNYHALKNITIEADEQYPAIFETLSKTASLRRLDVLDLDIECESEDYVGVIAKNYGSVSDLKVTGSILGHDHVGAIGLNGVRATDDDTDTTNASLTRITNEAEVRGLNDVGGVCGSNLGEIDDSVNRGEVSTYSKNPNDTGANIGGIAGYSIGKLNGNENSGNITLDLTALNVGGIVGKANGELYFERNYGDVEGTKYVGGIAGYYGNLQKNKDDIDEYFSDISWEDLLDDNLSWLKDLGFDVNPDEDAEDEIDENVNTIAFDYSYSEGTIKGDSNIGGILGFNTSTSLDIREAVSKTDVNLRTGTYGGGIVGNMPVGTISYSLASGHIKGKSQIGGLAGRGCNLKDNLSSALVEGSDQVGGIVGELSGEMTSNLSNALVINSDNKSSAGSVAGSVDSFDEVNNSFLLTVQYNYYISDLGGIGRRDYGAKFSDAAKHLTVEEMTTDDGTLSSSFGDGFDKDGFTAGKDEESFPTPKYLTEADWDKDYGSEEDFNAQYDTYKAIFKANALYDSKVTFLVTFMEWRQENGDLYDEYDKVDYTHYEITSYDKVSYGESLEDEPEFKYAKKEDDVYIYSSDENTYIVSWEIPEDEITSNIVVYADYEERVKTLTADSNNVVVEGNFAKGTTLEVVTNSAVKDNLIYCLRFYDKDGNELSFQNLTVKIKASTFEGKDLYYVDGAQTSRIQGTLDSSGYFIFRYSTGQYFAYVDEQDVVQELPIWVIPTVAASLAVLVAILILCIGLSVGRKKGIKEEQKANGTYEYHTLTEGVHASKKKAKKDDKPENKEENKKEETSDEKDKSEKK